MRTLAGLATTLALGCHEARPGPREAGSAADLVVVAPTIHTLDPTRPRAGFVAIRGDRIAAVGDRADLPRHVGPSTRVVELPPGSCVIPGFVESHAHLLGIGQALRELDLVGTRSFDEVVARTRERAARVPAGTWIRGRGWDQNDWDEKSFPHHRALSDAVPDHPVVLERIDGHAILANAAALARAGVDAGSAAPSGGEILRDAEGEPTGVLVDAAAALVERVIPAAGDAELDEALALALAECARLGITQFHDAGVGRRTFERLARAADEGRLTTRIYAMLDGSDREWVDEWLARGPWEHPGGHLVVRSIKLYADGALGSRGALLLEDYADRPGHRGLASIGREDLAAITRRALAAGYQVCTHAIGDGANRLVLDCYEEALRAAGGGTAEPRALDARLRIEHAQILAPEDIPRFARLGVIASMQTSHATSDGPWVVARIGEERARAGAYAWRSLLDSGAALCNGTDAPVERLSPLRNFAAAITRFDRASGLERPFFPEQRMTPSEALVAATGAGAFAAFAEREIGMIRAGMKADLVGLSIDPLASEPGVIAAGDALLTLVGGRAVHSPIRANTHR